MEKNIKDLKTLIDKESLYKGIKELAQKINYDYPNDEELVLVCILKGAVMFFTELSKHLKMPVRMEFITLSSYGNAQNSTGKVKAINLNLENIENKNVLIVEDIIDTGITLNFLMNYIQTSCKTKSAKLAVLLNKKCERKFCINPDYSAFDVDDKFIVGFGLDYQNLYRNIDFIGYFE